MTNVVELANARDLTLSQQERLEQLVWTDNQGRGWKARTARAADLPCLQSANDGLTARQAPGDRVMVIGLLARLANHWKADRSESSWTMLFEDYAADLDGISEAHMREITEAHRKESPWFPKVAELVSRWAAIQGAEAIRLHRVRVLLGMEEPKSWER